MSWRPSENWDAKKVVEKVMKDSDLAHLGKSGIRLEDLVEAGADALLEMLREQGMEVGKGCISCVFALPPPARFNNGYVVFIPENQP